MKLAKNGHENISSVKVGVHQPENIFLLCRGSITVSTAGLLLDWFGFSSSAYFDNRFTWLVESGDSFPYKVCSMNPISRCVVTSFREFVL